MHVPRQCVHMQMLSREHGAPMIEITHILHQFAQHAQSELQKYLLETIANQPSPALSIGGEIL
jgi:hypothetical protein